MEAQKPVIYIGKTDKDLLACCPNCESNIDWTFECTVLGLEVIRWKNGKRRKCIHCGTLIDWNGI